ncbi:MAG TPA: quinone oxidoreductase [Candidatus Cybelea sp.]|nr:quinone oxidoreductase [Candidatus Cybelea sp.]
MKANAIRIHETGGPEVLRWEEVEVSEPGTGEVTIRNQACGLNFIDTYQRSGLYPMQLPSGLGLEGAGTVAAVGPGVSDFKTGDRVAYCSAPAGAYTSIRNYPAERLVKLPDAVDFETAAGMMLQGMTVEYLVRRTYPVKAGDFVLFHAAAGGVGTIAMQWLASLGAVTIGTAGSAEKCAIAKSLGAAHVINYRTEDWVKRVKEITDGKGVHVVYDGVGKDTFLPSLDCLRPRGMMVTFGNASGPVPEIQPLILSQKGSLFLTRPMLFHYISSRSDLDLSASALFDVVTRGVVKIQIGHRYPLKETAQAHRDLEARKTTGATILVP